MVRAYVGLGTNLGDKMANLRAALALLAAAPGVRVLRVAGVYRTAPWGHTDQDWFLNTVAELETVLPPRALLEVFLGIEARLGRRRGMRWGPRVIDLDLLVYGDLVVYEPDLVVPHPRMHERAFVLVPLAELEPSLRLADGRTVAGAAEALRREQEVVRHGRLALPATEAGVP
ncbi:MAG: 2-amino-4-hydroxy-6-hydroxymethyldihydropteridine diphosphokinase [Desulfotomaculales bacterium]